MRLTFRNWYCHFLGAYWYVYFVYPNAAYSYLPSLFQMRWTGIHVYTLRTEADVSSRHWNISPNQIDDSYSDDSDWLKTTLSRLFVADRLCYQNSGFNEFYPMMLQKEILQPRDWIKCYLALRRSRPYFWEWFTYSQGFYFCFIRYDKVARAGLLEAGLSAIFKPFMLWLNVAA